MTTLEEKIFAISMTLIPVTKDVTGNIQGKEYKYASLSSIREALKEPLAEHNVAYRFTVMSMDASQVLLGLEIMERGVENDAQETMSTSMIIPVIQAANENIFHTIGMGLTYYKKNMLSTIFNLNIDEDIDVNVKQVKKIIAKSKDVKKIVKMYKGGMSVEDIKKEFVISEAIQQEINAAIHES